MPGFGTWTPRRLAPRAWYDAHLGGHSLGIADLSGNNRPPMATGAGSNAPLFLPYANQQAQVYLPGAAGNYVRCPRTAAHAISDDIDIEIHFDRIFGVGVPKVLHASEDGPTSRHWRVLLSSTNFPALIIFPDGTTGTELLATATAAITDATRAIRVTRRRSDGRTQFFTSTSEDSSNPSWAQLGSDVAAGAGSAIYTATSSAYLEIGSRFAGVVDPMVGFVRRFILRNGIGGTTVADFNPALCTQSGYTDQYGNPWTVNRSTSGRKAVVQNPLANSARSLFLLGTDDFLSVPAAAIPASSATDNFSVVVVAREWATPAGNQRFFDDNPGAGGGLLVFSNSTTSGINARLGDSVPNLATAAVASTTLGQRLVISATVSGQAADGLKLLINGLPQATASLASVGDRPVATTPAVGKISTGSSGFADIEFEALLTFDRALTATEHAMLVSYYRGGL